MTVLVDTSVWSLALRRDLGPESAHVDELRRVLAGADLVVTTGLVLQEVLQGAVPATVRAQILERFDTVPLVHPDRDDHIAAADLRGTCRAAGVQLGTVDALLAQLAIRHDLVLLTADQDFVHASRHVPLHVWRSG